MNKRLRKKLGLAEFDWLGFMLTSTVDWTDARENDRICDAMIAAVERLRLECGGPLDDLFIMRVRLGKWITGTRRRVHYEHCTDADRDALVAAVSAIPGVRNVKAGELVRSSLT